MADVFLSYAREDRHIAAQLAHVIAKQGWSVWSDQKIRAGTLFPRIIERELDACRCVVVVWSRHAVDSDWVLSEATEGLNRHILVPVAIENGLRLPLQFRHRHTVDLSRWPSEEDGLVECLAAIRDVISTSPAEMAQSQETSESPHHSVNTQPSGESELPPKSQVHVRARTPTEQQHKPVPRKPASVAAGGELRRLAEKRTPTNVRVQLPHEIAVSAGFTSSSHRAHHLRHHAVTTLPLSQDQPLLWSASQRDNYFTAKHRAVIGTLVGFFVLLAFVLLILLWYDFGRNDGRQKPPLSRSPRPAPNFGVKLSRPVFGPAAELPASSQA